jgi:hypothetical protein
VNVNLIAALDKVLPTLPEDEQVIFARAIKRIEADVRNQETTKTGKN